MRTPQVVMVCRTCHRQEPDPTTERLSNSVITLTAQIAALREALQWVTDLLDNISDENGSINMDTQIGRALTQARAALGKGEK